MDAAEPVAFAQSLAEPVTFAQSLAEPVTFAQRVTLGHAVAVVVRRTPGLSVACGSIA